MIISQSADLIRAWSLFAVETIRELIETIREQHKRPRIFLAQLNHNLQ